MIDRQLNLPPRQTSYNAYRRRRRCISNSAPMCHWLLSEQLGYLSDTKIAEDILIRTFQAPRDIDDATVLLLDEIG